MIYYYFIASIVDKNNNKLFSRLLRNYSVRHTWSKYKNYFVT